MNKFYKKFSNNHSKFKKLSLMSNQNQIVQKIRNLMGFLTQNMKALQMKVVMRSGLKVVIKNRKVQDTKSKN